MALYRHVVRCVAVYLFGFCALTAAVARAQSVLTPAETYDRCYLRMVRAVPPANEPNLLKVKAGTMTAEAACLALLDRARLGANGKIADANDPVARAVLRTFHDFHGSWFQSRMSSQGAVQNALATALVIDSEEPALNVTRALFSGVDYDSILKGSTPLTGIRSRGARGNLNRFEAQRLIKYPSNIPALQNLDELRVAYAPPGSTTASAVSVPDGSLVDTGELIGIRAALPFVAPSINIMNAGLTPAQVTDLRQNPVINKNYGGGIIGSQAYLMANANLGLNISPDGDASINRVIAARAFEDLLCQQLPTLKLEDITAEQQELVRPAAEQMFRRDKSCMQCHGQIDYFAYGYRNLVLSQTESNLNLNGRNQVGLPVNSLVQYPVNPASGLFWQTAPTGTLRYRTHRGTAPVKMNFSSLEQLGGGLAASPDFYECAAKRYYKFFTGIDVPLTALGAKPASSAAEALRLKYTIDAEHQQAVLKLATELKANKSLRSLVAAIIGSTVFKTRNYRSAKEIQK